MPLSEQFLKHYIDAEPPWGEVGYVTYKRTYARKIGNRTEEWFETCARCVNGLEVIGGKFTQSELEKLFDIFFNLKGLCSGRALWQLGTTTMDKVGADSLNNCWSLPIDVPESFCFVFNQLMLGGGVGFTITPEYVYSLPVVQCGEVVREDSFDVDFIVPDNREGWVHLLRKVLIASFSGKSFTYSTRAIRARGLPIKGFGGTASGSEALVKGISQICEIIKTRNGKKLRPIDCLDILNIIGSIVVAGNVRRSAEIAIGDCRDLDFLRAKNWSTQQVPNWRAMSNNTVLCNNISDLPEDFWKGYDGSGEPYGLFNLDLSRKKGRLIDTHRIDPQVTGTNPCGEISLSGKDGSGEACNLSEIFLPNIENEEEFKEVAVLLYKYCKTVSNYPVSDEGSREIISNNRRLGIGVTGFVQATHLHDEDLFDRVYRDLEIEDKNYSKELGIPESIKLTTVKPSGTLSLLAGVTSGGHDAYSEYLIRRIRFASDDPLIEICRENNYHVEPVRNFDQSIDPNSTIVEFPVHYPNGLSSKHSAVDQLERQKWLQTYWSDNAVSITVYYTLDELPAIKEWLSKNYKDGVKAASFLLHAGHGFQQAPLEEINEEKYWELKASTQPISKITDTEELTMGSVECVGGHCPVR